MKKRYFIISIIIFLLVLSGLRIKWMGQFQQSSNMQVISGELDLREWDANNKEVLLLDGEWEFFPNEWLIENNSEEFETNKYVNVPKGWNEHFPNAYGYGTYRMKLLVDPNVQSNYSLFFPSIRSASEIYINGKLLSSSGEIGTSNESTHARNIPQQVTFSPDELGVIEIIVQASNFQDIRRSGVIRSVKFGTEIAMTHERNLSLSMQVLASGTFLLHALYAIVLFFLGKRDKKLLYFSLLLLCLTIVNMTSTDEKIIHLLMNIPYDWDFRIANSFGMLILFSLLKSFDHEKIPYWRHINPILSTISISIVFIILLLTPAQIIKLFPLFGVVAFFTILIIVVTVIRKVSENLYGNLLLLFSILATAHHFGWIVYWREIGISVVHYPIDFIVALGCFSSVWFKDYFTVHAETKKLASELEITNKHKDQFLAQTSHEFKNPLHGIINMSQAILHREKSLDATSANELKMIRSVGRRLSLLLNDLLDDASLKDGKPRLNKQVFELQAIVVGIFDLLKFMVDMKPVKLVNKIRDDFPPVYGDENRVIQIIYNLMHNAIKYTDEGEVVVYAYVENDQVFISIRDTGKGIHQSHVEKILLPYEQITSSAITDGGYGLGLSISKQLIELHGGTLEVTSDLNEGSTFTFSLPLASEEQIKLFRNQLTKTTQSVLFETYDQLDLSNDFFAMNEQQIAASSEQHTLSHSTNQKIHLLVVDDDPINLNVMRSILSAEIFDVTTVTSGNEALKVIDDKPWSLVISDIMMPHMSGFELTRKIRERFTFTDLPILLLTARNDPKDIHAGFAAGANDYVTKPVEYLELTSRVNVLIAVKNAVQEQLRLKTAWLQAQIQPHFLFNTLNSVIALSSIDTKQMNDLLIELSNYLRSKFQYNDIDELIPIHDELELVKSYINIEKVRFGERLKVEWDFNEISNVKIPFLTIQPLVENAIHHGLMKKVSGGQLTICISDEGETVTISVADNGLGINEEKLAKILHRNPSKGESIGLVNTNQRLMQHFGTGLHIESTLGKGTTVSFTVPRYNS